MQPMYQSIKHTAGKIRVLKVRLEFFLNLSRKLRVDPQNESNNFKSNKGRITCNLSKENMSKRSTVTIVGFDNWRRILKGGKA